MSGYVGARAALHPSKNMGDESQRLQFLQLKKKNLLMYSVLRNIQQILEGENHSTTELKPTTL